MQVYGLRFFNFMRFGEKDNSVVFDISPDDQILLDQGKITIDAIYDKLCANPITYIGEAKKRGLTNLIGIAGIMGDNYDFSNGVGKSTILEGICYAHYEKVVRRNANTDKIATAGLSVVTKINKKYPPDMKESWVEEIFEESGKVYRIKRGRSFSSSHNTNSPIHEFFCYNDGADEDSQSSHRKKDTNESIAIVTPMDYDLFVNSVMFGQSDAGKFLMGTDKTRKEMMVALLRLEDIINGCLENIRKRKNNKDKDITALNAQIDVLEGNIKSKQTTEALEAQIKALQGNIKALEAQIKANNGQIEELSKSEVMKVLDGIREEGKKTKEALLERKETKESQVKEWKNLYLETEKKEQSQIKKIDALVEKRKEIQAQIASLNSEIQSFDLSVREEELKKADKAREMKPKFVDGIRKIQEEKEKLLGSLAEERSEYNRLSKEVSALQKQLKMVKGEEFVCDKCKSRVTRKHIESEVNKNTIEVQKHVSNMGATEKTIKESSDKLAIGQKKLDAINECLIRENKVRSEIKDNDNKKQKLEDLKKMQCSDYDKMYSDMQRECEDFKKQKGAYRARSEEISKKYDDEIQRLQSQLDGLAAKFTAAKKDAEDIEGKIKSIRESVSNATQKKSDCDSQIGSLRKDIETTQKEAEKLSQLKNKQSEEMAMLNRLVLLDEIFGLEGIQTRIVKKYLPLLNIYVKEVMDILTNGEMKVVIYINDKSKVDMDIEGGSADNFIMLSGGEKQLVRLAVDIGLALLSFTRCAQKPEIIALDEIFDPLDGYHTQSVFNLIHKLQEKFNRVLVISHKENINKIIKNQILIEKGTGIFGLSKVRRIT